MDIFGEDDFDPIKYINEKFPDENSLVNLDSEIELIKKEITRLDKEILEDIHQHAVLNKKTKDELSNTHLLTKKLITEIKSIQQKSLESETIVQEMCKDIKTLDLAKKNITLSINCLRKFADLISSLDHLRTFSTQRDYKQAAHVLLSIIDLSNYFKTYQKIPQIKEVLKNKDTILSTLKLQINDEFSLYFKNMSNQGDVILQNACVLVEVLGPDFKKKIVQMAVDSVLGPYKELYQRRDNKNIEGIEKRYVWFSRSLTDFKNKYSKIFPHYWGILCFIVNEFCGVTSLHVSEILPSIRGKEDMVVPMIKALQSTINFENAMYKELKSEYEQYLKTSDLNYNANKISNVPNIKGSISKCFENYTGPYVQKEEKDLNEVVFKELNFDLSKKKKFTSNNEELNIFNSSLIMFKKIKFLLERASKISRGQTMVSIYRTIKINIKKYIEIVQSQILKEELLLKKEDKEEKRFLLNLCVLINTVDYTKETVNKMNDIIQNLIDEPFNQNLDFSEEEDFCSKVSIDIINSMMKLYKNKLEYILNYGMLKVQWDKLENSIKASNYVSDIKNIMKFFSEQIKSNINNVYVIRALKIMSEETNIKFLNYIYRIKKLNQISVQRLNIDFGEIKLALYNIGMTNGESISNIYNSVSERHCEKTENIIKILGSDLEKIDEVIVVSLKNMTRGEITKILNLKGMKKSDINQIIEKYNI